MKRTPTLLEQMRLGVRVEIPYEASHPLSPIARSQWPLWVRTIAKAGHGVDLGVGDTVARLLDGATLGGAAMVKTLVPCGCARRPQEWNERYPYQCAKAESGGDSKLAASAGA